MFASIWIGGNDPLEGEVGPLLEMMLGLGAVLIQARVFFVSVVVPVVLSYLAYRLIRSAMMKSRRAL